VEQVALLERREVVVHRLCFPQREHAVAEGAERAARIVLELPRGER